MTLEQGALYDKVTVKGVFEVKAWVPGKKQVGVVEATAGPQAARGGWNEGEQP
jgi:hypothetical protein